MKVAFGRWVLSMSSIHVCSLARVADTVEEVGASHLVTLVKPGLLIDRPKRILENNHLSLGFNDIVKPSEGLIAPAESHVRGLIEFIQTWDQTRPMVIHCWAGISRSTAAAFIAMCYIHPEEDEAVFAREIRRASIYASPNILLVHHADKVLGRDSRMARAIQEIGRGPDAEEGDPFFLSLNARAR